MARGYGNQSGNSRRASSPTVLKGQAFKRADKQAQMLGDSGTSVGGGKAKSPTVIAAKPGRAPVRSQATDGSVAGPTKPGGFKGYEHRGGWSGK